MRRGTWAAAPLFRSPHRHPPGAAAAVGEALAPARAAGLRDARALPSPSPHPCRNRRSARALPSPPPPPGRNRRPPRTRPWACWGDRLRPCARAPCWRLRAWKKTNRPLLAVREDGGVYSPRAVRLPPTPCRVCFRPCVFNKFSHFWQKTARMSKKQIFNKLFTRASCSLASSCRAGAGDRVPGFPGHLIT